MSDRPSRIPLFPTEAMTDAQRAVYQAIVNGPRGKVVGPLRAALHSPELADRWQRLGELLRYRTSLPPRSSELAILVVARHWDSQFEWYAHKRMALEAGLEPAIVDAINHRRTPVFDDDAKARLVYDFATTLHRDRKVPEALYREAVATLGERGVVELVGLLGYYTLVSMTLNAFDVGLPEGETSDLVP